MLRVACGAQENITENFLKIINFSRVLADVADRLVEEGLREYQWVNFISWAWLSFAAKNIYNFYMVCVCSRYNARSDWYYFSCNTYGQITDLQRRSKKPYNKQIDNLERSFYEGKSQVVSFGQYGKVSVWGFPVETSLSLNNWVVSSCSKTLHGS